MDSSIARRDEPESGIPDEIQDGLARARYCSYVKPGRIYEQLIKQLAETR